MVFVGNVDAHELFLCKSDVVVCSGFVGNIALKTLESLGVAIIELLKREFSKNLLSKIGAYLTKPVISRLKKEIDYAEYGGAPLLGLNGVCIISHGRSSAKAITNAIRVAAEFMSHQMNQHIIEAIEATAIAPPKTRDF